MNLKPFGMGLCALALAASMVACSSEDDSGKADDNCVKAGDGELDALFAKWDEALRSGDATKVAALYRPDAVLLPTLSMPIADTPQEITDYFVNLIKANPKPRMELSVKKSECNLAYDTGLWVINANGADVHARVTWVYEYENGGWLIATHHSSVDPAAPAA
ncbi:nuclear transport factor 2 family protein [Antrihabitans sp. YC2-6]|uniref:nuclear transport factor 2 family protein n=1 Tax=Antrihabitans sp. YC2-6 TaxID=2799498 RepID=UPI0018F792C7|nr:nuclear transport factor 2 family protein [Antrihabitans sp. YC2-6]MBJ8346749.1 nuclear transport factor 2 family protein [Antrihabitans sp. YC2-6]